MLDLVKEIIRLVGRMEGYQLLAGNVKLRRKNQIKSIYSSLAIEGNSLSEEQVTAILDGKRVLGKPQDIHEVANAIKVYETLDKIDPFNEDNLLATHQLLMSGLITDAGRYRQGGVGVIDGTKVVHLAPPAKQVPRLMGDLFDYLINYPEDLIIKSCVFHFEFEYIHPFSDGNGRMGRLWQTAILKEEYPDLAFVPIESMVYEAQAGYYRALQESQYDANSNAFILFSLQTIKAAIEEQLASAVQVPSDYQVRLKAFAQIIGKASFTRKEYQVYHKSISPATTTRDLTVGAEEGILVKTGKLRTTRYQFAPNP